MEGTAKPVVLPAREAQSEPPPAPKPPANRLRIEPVRVAGLQTSPLARCGRRFIALQALRPSDDPHPGGLPDDSDWH